MNSYNVNRSKIYDFYKKVSMKVHRSHCGVSRSYENIQIRFIATDSLKHKITNCHEFVLVL